MSLLLRGYRDIYLTAPEKLNDSDFNLVLFKDTFKGYFLNWINIFHKFLHGEVKTKKQTSHKKNKGRPFSYNAKKTAKIC